VISSPSTAFCKFAPLFFCVVLACGDRGDGSAVDDEPSASTLADVLAGGEPTPELWVELEGLAAEGSGKLAELAGRVAEGELTPAEADSLYADWLAGEASARSLTAEQLGRLLTGWVGGRYR
jgi:hypothetical protein